MNIGGGTQVRFGLLCHLISCKSVVYGPFLDGTQTAHKTFYKSRVLYTVGVYYM